MIPIEMLCSKLNQKIKNWKTIDIYIPIYETKWKLFLISKLKSLFQKFGYRHISEENVSYVNYWKFIKPDRWIKTSNMPKTTPENCDDLGNLWYMGYYDELWENDLSFGTKPSNAAYDARGGAPSFYGSKLNGEIYIFPVFSSFALSDFPKTPNFLSEDHKRYINREKSEINWESHKE